MKKVAVWGDSILKGAVTGLNPDHLFDIIEDNSLALAEKSLGFELYNDSVFGSIITKSQRRMNRFFEKGEKCDIAIIESGGNDSDYDWISMCNNPVEISSPRVPLSDFMRIIDEMVQTARTNGAVPVLMTMPRLVADRWFTHITRGLDENIIRKFLGGESGNVESDTRAAIDRLSVNHEIYNLNIIEYANANNVFLVDMRKSLLETRDYRALMCLDGIHPNTEGYKFMATVWGKELPKVL